MDKFIKVLITLIIINIIIFICLEICYNKITKDIEKADQHITYIDEGGGDS